MNRATALLGGALLAAGAAGLVIGGVIHGPQPPDLEGFAEVGATWTLSHALIALAGALFAVSSLFITRGFDGTPGEAPALAGTGALLLTGVGFLAVGVLETTGFATAVAAGSGEAAEAAFLATTAVMTALATAAGYTFAAAVAAYGVAMVASPGWPGWLGWVGIAAGALYGGLTAFGLSLPVLPQVPFYLLGAWLVVMGGYFTRSDEAISGEAEARAR